MFLNRVWFLMEKYRFYILLAVLFALFFSTPIVNEIVPDATPMALRVVVTVLFVLMLLSAVLAVGQTRWTPSLSVVLALPLVTMYLLLIKYDHRALVLWTHLFGIVFLGYTVVVIVRFLFTADRVSLNTLCAAICVYLLLGIWWAQSLSTLELLHPGSFSAVREENNPVIHFGDEHSIDALYFSFVTLTTLGYGDITPRSDTAKMLVALEALVGQLFLAILVARLVGLHITCATRKRREDDGI